MYASIFFMKETFSTKKRKNKKSSILFCSYYNIHYLCKTQFSLLITNLKERKIMEKFVCDVCGYVYDPAVGDPDNGIESGTAFADLQEDWVCPICGVGKDEFSREEE